MVAPLPGRPLRVACFGAGWVTVNRHVPALRAHGGFDVVAIADPVPGRAQDAGRRLRIPRSLTTGDPAELANDVDAVTCGTPPPTHYALARAALEAGLPVLVEKPFTLEVSEGEELVALASQRGLPLAVMQNFCVAPSTLRARRWIDQGRLGTVRAVWAVQLSSPARRLPAWYEDFPGGLFYDESPNLIALARLFAGTEPQPVSARVQPAADGRRTPAQVDAALTAGDVAVTLLMHFEAPVSEWHVAVVGDRAMATVDLFRDIAVFTPGDRRHLALDTLRTSAATTGGHWAGVVRSGAARVRGRLRYGTDEAMALFHGAVAEGRPLGPIDAREALATTRVQHWIMAGGA
jgi:predicted dehydrogenase